MVGSGNGVFGGVDLLDGKVVFLGEHGVWILKESGEERSSCIYHNPGLGFALPKTFGV